MVSLSPEEIQSAVAAALAEDLGGGDVTTLATVPESLRVSAILRAREPLVVAGLEITETTFRQLSAETRLERRVQDAARVAAGATVFRITGPARAILSAERVALNFLQRLSGVATETARYVEAIQGTGAQILDTRKTTPGWRRFEKYAVRCGGGTNHRLGLFDMILIKDNHLAALAGATPNPIAAAIRSARAGYADLKVEVEADSLEQVRQAADAGADFILLDNMSCEELRQAVALVKKRARLEASGGVHLNNIRTIAETGVDFISVGAITHSARAVDLGLDFE